MQKYCEGNVRYKHGSLYQYSGVQGCNLSNSIATYIFIYSEQNLYKSVQCELC